MLKEIKDVLKISKGQEFILKISREIFKGTKQDF